MGTATLLALIAAGASIVLQFWPRKSTPPAQPDDPFSGLPGLPGHPLLNWLAARKQGQNALTALADLMRADPAIAEQMRELLAKD